MFIETEKAPEKFCFVTKNVPVEIRASFLKLRNDLTVLLGNPNHGRAFWTCPFVVLSPRNTFSEKSRRVGGGGCYEIFI